MDHFPYLRMFNDVIGKLGYTPSKIHIALENGNWKNGKSSTYLHGYCNCPRTVELPKGNDEPQLTWQPGQTISWLEA